MRLDEEDTAQSKSAKELKSRKVSQENSFTSYTLTLSSSSTLIYMPSKPIKTTVKVVLKAGEASPAPPLGPILGQHGVNIMDFVKQYNERTSDKKGDTVPAVITIYEDRSFDFETKLAPVSSMILKELNIDKGSGEAPREVVGELTKDQVKKIAEAKMEDLNTDDLDAAIKIVKGSARSMGVTVKEK